MLTQFYSVCDKTSGEVLRWGRCAIQHVNIQVKDQETEFVVPIYVDPSTHRVDPITKEPVLKDE